MAQIIMPIRPMESWDLHKVTPFERSLHCQNHLLLIFGPILPDEVLFLQHNRAGAPATR